MRTWPGKCIRTKACIRRTACRMSSNGSTRPCSAPTRSTMQKGTNGLIGLHRSLPMQKPALAALNVFELTKAMIEAGAASVHLEDQLSSEKKCGHLGGKVLQPTQTAIRHLIAARLAADVMGVPTVIIARTDANAANLITSDVDPYDAPFITGERTAEGFYRTQAGIDQAIARGLAYAPYADMIWCETSEPNLDEARRFAEAIHEKFPGKLLAYNCSPSFNWKKKLDDKTIANFQKEIARMGYKFQFVTLAGFHALNHSMFELAATTATAAWRPIPNCSRQNLRTNNMVTRQHAISAKSAPAISMKYRWSSQAALLLLPHLQDRPSKNNSPINGDRKTERLKQLLRFLFCNPRRPLA